MGAPNTAEYSRELNYGKHGMRAGTTRAQPSPQPLRVFVHIPGRTRWCRLHTIFTKKNQRSNRREQHSGGFREACKRSCPGVVAPTYLLNRKEVAHGKLQARGRRQRVRVGGGGTAPDWRVRVRVRVWVLGAAKAAVMRQSVRRCNKQTKHQGQGKTHESSHAAFKQPVGRGDDSTGCKKKKKNNNNNNNGRAGAAAAT